MKRLTEALHKPSLLRINVDLKAVIGQIIMNPFTVI